MTVLNSNERKHGLEVATYANSLRIALKRCGIFQKGDRAVGLRLPPGAALDKYHEAVKALLIGAGILHYAVPIVRVSTFKEETDADEALNALSLGRAVIVLVANGAELPPRSMSRSIT